MKQCKLENIQLKVLLKELEGTVLRVSGSLG